MIAKTFRTTVVQEGSMCFIPLTFDPKAVFGRVRAPVSVTLNGFVYRSTIAAWEALPLFRCEGAIGRPQAWREDRRFA